MKTDKDMANAELMGAAIYMLRRKSGKTAREVAEDMKISVKAYEHFERGRTNQTVDRLQSFALSVSADLASLLFVPLLKDPMLALYCADKKPLMTLIGTFCDLYQRIGEDVSLIGIDTMFAAAKRTMNDLETSLKTRDLFHEKWVSDMSSQNASLWSLLSASRKPKT